MLSPVDANKNVSSNEDSGFDSKERETPRLESWIKRGDRLYGMVFNHPRFDDGDEIITSPVQFMSAFFAQTLNTSYVLGSTSPAQKRL
jgi:hypothetical protein